MEVLSRGISMLVNDGFLSLVAGPRGTLVPSHVLYADDVMIFCRGNLSNLRALKKLFSDYGDVSGQIINPLKSTIYAGSISHTRKSRIADLLGFHFGEIPFIYLGIPIFKGKPKAIHLMPIADRIKSKLAAWKASLLSIAGRVQLV
ncbi:RNA-directed DNA polymerase (Reverse transcriptase), partial [Trifolium medium]|nr:RNA-directed DNA polymerase (Reverse transcriptase) [Trifolium medium]